MPARLSLVQARRLAVMGALLAAPRPRSVLEVVEWLGGLQIDPTSTVARAEQLVLWSRLGPYDVGQLERLLRERALFEYRAFLVPASDLAVHRASMRRYPHRDQARASYVRDWLAANAAFRRYLLRELRSRGPLRSRELEDRAVEPWRTGGWNDGKNLGRMLELLWIKGEIAIVGRDGNERLWDLAGRWYPPAGRQPPQRELARRLLDSQLRWCGIARPDGFGFALDGAPAGREAALRELVREGRVLPVTVDGLRGEWLAHADLLDRPFRPRTTLLCPFDKLIANRRFTEEVFGFRYRLEIYQPKAKREYGYYVLPILHGERLIGRIDPVLDRKAAVLRVNAVFAEPDAPADAWPAVRQAIDELATWVGAEQVVLPRLPPPWR